MVKAGSEIFLGRASDGLEAMDAIIPELERLQSNYVIQAAPRGVALVMLGRIAEGIRAVEQQIAQSDAIGDQNGGVSGRIILAEIYIHMLSGKERPPAHVLFRNLWAVIGGLILGARRARTLLMEAAAAQMLSERGVLAARINLDLGLLSAMRRKRDEARSYFDKARVCAESQCADKLLQKIDAALAELRRAH